MISVPVITPRLSSLWLALITPIYARIGRKLVDSIRNPTIVRDQSSLTAFNIQPLGPSAAIAAALCNEDSEFAVTRWSDSLSAAGAQRTWVGVRFGNRLIDARCIDVTAPPRNVFRVIRRIGGATGWYYGNWLWQMRGWCDLLVGGIGLRRGRRDPEELRVGDAVDFWRVEAVEINRRLRFVAEMKLPGRAWLEYTLEPHGGRTRITQHAIFDPVGLAGLAYWYTVYPLHRFIFSGMLSAIGRKAEQIVER